MKKYFKYIVHENYQNVILFSDEDFSAFMRDFKEKLGVVIGMTELKEELLQLAMQTFRDKMFKERGLTSIAPKPVYVFQVKT